MYNREYVPEYFSGLGENEIWVIAGNINGISGTYDEDFVRHYSGDQIWVGEAGFDQIRTYAIPLTHGGIDALKPYVDEFIEFAKQHKEYKFILTWIGHGFVGFGIKRCAPLFAKAIDVENIYMPKKFVDIIEGNCSKCRKGIKYLKRA